MTSKASACAVMLTIVAYIAISFVQGTTTQVPPTSSLSQGVSLRSTSSPVSKNNNTGSGTDGMVMENNTAVVDKPSLEPSTVSPETRVTGSSGTQEQLDINTVPIETHGVMSSPKPSSIKAPTSSKINITDGDAIAPDIASLAGNVNTSKPDIPILRGNPIRLMTATPSSQVTDQTNTPQSSAVTEPTIPSSTPVIIDIKTNPTPSHLTDKPTSTVADSAALTINKTDRVSTVKPVIDLISTVLPSISPDADNSSSDQQQPDNVSQSSPSPATKLASTTTQTNIPDTVNASANTAAPKQTTEIIKTVTGITSGSYSTVTALSNETKVNASSMVDVSSLSMQRPPDVSSQSTLQPPENGSSSSTLRPPGVSLQSTQRPPDVSSQSTLRHPDVSSQHTVAHEEVSSQSTVHPNDGAQNNGSDSNSGTPPTGTQTLEATTERVVIHDITGEGNSSGLDNVSKQKVITTQTSLSTNGKIALGICIPLAIVVATAIGGILIWKRRRPRESLSALFDGMKTHFQYSYQNASQVDNDETSFILK